jgi:hypothetical protein
VSFGKSALLLWRVQLTGKLKKLVLIALATAGMVTGTMSGSASAIDTVPCGNGEFASLDLHRSFDSNRYIICFANSGTANLRNDPGAPSVYWADKIWTGNNRVQWYGDGRWQPDQPIDKYTAMFWPSFPGGVRIEALRIL